MQGFLRLFYSTSYTVVFLVLVLLLAVTPGDTIYQSIRDSQLQNVFIVAGAYILAGILVLFFYGSRLYTSRTVLAAIPKSYIPIEVGDVGSKVQRMIAKQLDRSALIAWNSRPRDLQTEVEHARNSLETQLDVGKSLQATFKDDEINQLLRDPKLLFDPCNPPWGNIEHQGWSSSNSADFPNLQFSMVVKELPHLIEAKAVSLASPDAQQIIQASGDSAGQYVPDQMLLGFLQRSASMDLRDYLAQLILVGMIIDEDTAIKFVAQYESAHYSDEGLTESQFRDLMASFSSLLSNMVEIRQSTMRQILDNDEGIMNGLDNPMSDLLTEGSVETPRMPVSAQNLDLPSGSPKGELDAIIAGNSVREAAVSSISVIAVPPSSKVSRSLSLSQISTTDINTSRSNSLSAASIQSHQSVIRHNISV